MIPCTECGGLMAVTHTRQTKRGEYKRFACRNCKRRMSTFGDVEHVAARRSRVMQTSRRFTADQVAAIRESSDSKRQLADRYGCSPELIRQIRAGLIYCDLLPAGYRPPPRRGERSCERCREWMGDACSIGFPDPLEEGPGFARDCSLYVAEG
jgi:hypothetical protein